MEHFHSACIQSIGGADQVARGVRVIIHDPYDILVPSDVSRDARMYSSWYVVGS